jgi:hypothetical protein
LLCRIHPDHRIGDRTQIAFEQTQMRDPIGNNLRDPAAWIATAKASGR